MAQTRVTIDGPSSGATYAGPTQFWGWAIDDQTAIASVSVQIDSVYYGNASYGSSRGDVCAAYPRRAGCPNVGWTMNFDTTWLGAGVHTIIATANTTDGRQASTSTTFNAQLQAPPGVAINFDGRLEVFTEGTDCGGWHNWQTFAAGPGWSGNYSLGGCLFGPPVAVANSDGRMEVFAEGTDRNVYHNWQVSPGGGWSGWVGLGGGPISQPPSAIETSAGTLEIFVVQNGTVYTNEETMAGDSSNWKGWTAIGGASIATTPSVIADFGGKLYIFAQGTDGAAWFNFQTSPNGAWNGWTSLGGGIAGSPSVGLNSDGRLEIFVQGGGGTPYHNWQNADGTWSGWISLGGGIIGAPTVVANFDGRLEIFAVGAGNAVYHNYETAPGDSSSWSGWVSLGGSVASVAAPYRNIDGRVEVFAQTSDGNTWHNYQTWQGWSNWYVLGDPSSPSSSPFAADYTFGVKGGLLSGSENDAVLNFTKQKNSGNVPTTPNLGHWPCATVSVSFVGFDDKYRGAVQRAVDNWNKALTETYGPHPPVSFTRLTGDGVHSLTVRNQSITKDACDPQQISPYTQGYTHLCVAAKDSSGSFSSHIDIDINPLITNTQTITNVIAHEIGHTFDLAHCDNNCKANGSVMSANMTVFTQSLAMCRIAPTTVACMSQAVNSTQGLAAPTQVDMGAVRQANAQLNNCQQPQASNDPPTCNDGSTPSAVTGFASDGSAGDTTYSCNGTVCDSCNPSCSSYNSFSSGCGQPVGGGSSSCSSYCGSICMDNAVCPCGGEIPYCDEQSGGEFPACTNSCSPIVIDAFGHGFNFTDIGHGVRFRVTNNGPSLRMSWPDQNSRNGWLVLDRNENGVIDDLTELFGNMTPQPVSRDPNGYLALAVFDEPTNGGNGNGVIDPSDSVYNRLRLWIDANHNGVSEPDELYKLREAGIFRIGLTYHRSKYVDANGNQFRYKARIWDQAGFEHEVCYDVFLAVEAIERAQ